MTQCAMAGFVLRILEYIDFIAFTKMAITSLIIGHFRLNFAQILIKKTDPNKLIPAGI